MVLSSERSKGVFLIGLGCVTMAIGALIYKSFVPSVGQVLSLPVFVIGGLFAISGMAKVGRALVNHIWGDRKKEELESQKYMLDYFKEKRDEAKKNMMKQQEQEQQQQQEKQQQESMLESGEDPIVTEV